MSIGDKLKDFMGGGSSGQWAEDSRFRERHLASGGSAEDYDRYRPAYQYGYAAGSDASYRGRGFDEVESHLQNHWSADLSQRSGDWNSVRRHVSSAYREAQEAFVTRSEEELAIGKRQVQAGEVEVRKSVETEHVRENVPVMREEVTIERRPVDDRMAAADIGEDAIRIPLTQEEVVVEKRPVVKEQIIVRKHAVTENQTVQADLKRERVDVSGDTRSTQGGTSGSSDSRI